MPTNCFNRWLLRSSLSDREMSLALLPFFIVMLTVGILPSHVTLTFITQSDWHMLHAWSTVRLGYKSVDTSISICLKGKSMFCIYIMVWVESILYMGKVWVPRKFHCFGMRWKVQEVCLAGASWSLGARPGKMDLVSAFSSWSSLPFVYLKLSLLGPSEASRLDTQLLFGSTAIEVATVGYNLWSWRQSKSTLL